MSVICILIFQYLIPRVKIMLTKLSHEFLLFLRKKKRAIDCLLFNNYCFTFRFKYHWKWRNYTRINNEIRRTVNKIHKVQSVNSAIFNRFMKVIKLRSARNECDLLMFLWIILHFWCNGGWNTNIYSSILILLKFKCPKHLHLLT